MTQAIESDAFLCDRMIDARFIASRVGQVADESLPYGIVGLWQPDGRY